MAKEASAIPDSSPILHGRVGPTLLRLALPMALGMVSIILFNVVDAYFVAQLGEPQLAAMGFIFPFSFLVMSILMGLGVGTASVLARMIGKGDTGENQAMATHALYLGVVAGALLTALGLLLRKPLFLAMGADEAILPLIDDYFGIWLTGVSILAVPMIGNSILRATGDTRSPGLIMAIAALANMVLDPLLIFGIGPFPRLAMKGAALATVLSWGITFLASLWMITVRDRLVRFIKVDLKKIFSHWGRIFFIGLPAAGTNLLVPLTTSVLTRIVSEHGREAVAGFAVGGRLESLSMISIMALASVMTPFVGQNWGAGQHQRAHQALRFASLVSLLWGCLVCLVFLGIAGPLSRAFSDSPVVQQHIQRFLWILPWSFGSYGISMLCGSTFNALHRPLLSTMLILIRVLCLSLPLAMIGSTLWKIPGLFAGLAISNVLIGLIGYILVNRYLKTHSVPDEQEKTEPIPETGELPDGWE